MFVQTRPPLRNGPTVPGNHNGDKAETGRWVSNFFHLMLMN